MKIDAMAQAALIHKGQILKRVETIRDIAKSNQTGDVDIMGAALNHIEEFCETVLRDYSNKEVKTNDEQPTF